MYELFDKKNNKQIVSIAETLLYKGSLKLSKKHKLNENDLKLLLKYPKKFKQVIRKNLEKTYNQFKIVNIKINKLQHRLDTAFKKTKNIQFSCGIFSNKKIKKEVNDNKNKRNKLQIEIEKAKYKTDDAYQKAEDAYRKVKEEARIKEIEQFASRIDM
ncbi:MAG: hypothetical protein PVG30_01005 [Gammaproteobacteria bacterium]|jgi:hypothetical protein